MTYMSGNTMLFFIILLAIVFLAFLTSSKEPVKIMKIAVFLRLGCDCILALLLASSFFTIDLKRAYYSNNSTIIVAAGLVIDTLLTTMWLAPKRVYFLAHFILYVVLGAPFLAGYLIVMLNINGMGVIILIVIVPKLWVIGLVPMITFASNRRKLFKMHKESGEPAQDADHNDENFHMKFD